MIVTLVVTIGGFGATFYIYYNQDKFYLPFIDSANFKKEFESVNGKSIKGTDYTYSTLEIDDDNLYRIKDISFIRDVITTETGVILVGHKYSPNTRSVINALNEAGKNKKISDIYFIDVHGDDNRSSYYQLYNLIKDKLSKNKIIYPTVLFVKNGSILGVYEGTIDNHNMYYSLTPVEEETLINTYMDYIDLIK